MPLDLATHPTAETLAAFNSGTLPDPERGTVESHVANCDSCCSQLAAMSDDRLVGLVRKAAADLPATTAMVDLSDVPPELIDHPRYRVVSPLGAGGMGVVYKAEDQFMGRTVALKVVARRYTANAAAIERFRREVRAAAKLNHHNIVTAHDTGEVNGLHFLVMEYVEGISLDRLVQRKGPLPIATACQCIRQAAQGLQHAFEKGMVHRDIKPHNLMVTRKGQIKLLDFGLARVAAETDLPPLPSGTPSPDRTVTSASLVMGTPDYLAPEQTRNAHTVDIRADIYALGCVLYYLLTGKPPFAQFGTALEKMLAHVQDDPEPIRKVRPEVPTELADVLDRMMAKKPENRFATPADIANALKPFARGEAIIDESPEIVDTPTAPMIEAPTPPAAAVETRSMPRPAVKRPKPMKKRRRNTTADRLPWIIGGGVAALLLIAIAIIATRNLIRDGSDQGAGNPAGGKQPGGAAAVGKRVLFVVPNQGLYWPDYGPVRDRLRGAGIEVVTASTNDGRCELVTPPGGDPTFAEKKLADINANDYDAVLFSGFQVDEFIKGPGAGATERIIREMLSSKKIVGAICYGQRVLVHYLGIPRKERGVASANGIVVGGEAKDGPEFAAAVVKALEK